MYCSMPNFLRNIIYGQVYEKVGTVGRLKLKNFNFNVHPQIEIQEYMMSGNLADHDTGPPLIINLYPEVVLNTFFTTPELSADQPFR